MQSFSFPAPLDPCVEDCDAPVEEGIRLPFAPRLVNRGRAGIGGAPDVTTELSEISPPSLDAV